MTSPQTLHRQSILLRQKKAPSKTNLCNIELEHERNVMMWKAKAEKWRKYEEETRIALCPEREEKKKKQEELRLAMEEQQRMKEEEIRGRIEKEVVATQCPLSGPSFGFTGGYWEEQEARRQRDKREYLQSILEENKKLVAYRNAIQSWEREKEIEDERTRPRNSTWDKRHFR